MKAQRQKLIMSIIGSEDIETQEQLIARLNENGFRYAGDNFEGYQGPQAQKELTRREVPLYCL